MKRLLLFLCVPFLAFAADVTPEVRALLDKMVVAQGGRSNLERVKGLRMVVKASTSSGDVSIQITTRATWEKVHMSSQLSGGPESSQAYDGETAWAHHPSFGVRELGGSEKSALIRNTLRAARNRESVYNSLRIGKAGSFNGRTCVMLVASNPGETDVIFYVDEKSYRVLGTKVTQGGITGITTFRRFVRSAHGIFYPSELTIEASGTELIGKVVEYRENPTFSKGLFSKPKGAESPKAARE